MKLLMSPLHYFFSKNYGSELICAYEMFTRIHEKEKDVTAVCSDNLEDKKYQEYLVCLRRAGKPYFYSFLDNFKFIFFYTFKGFKLIRFGDYALIHHVFPFRIGKTFNPLILFSGQEVKKVIGPLQVSLDFNDKDQRKSSYFKNNNNFLLTNVVNILNPLYRFLSKMTLTRADKVIVINKSAKKEVMEYGVSEDRVVIIPIGIDMNKFNLSSNMKKNKEVVELVTVGYLIERKGIELIIKAMSKVVKKHNNVILRIIGEGPQRQALEGMAQEVGVDKHVIFEGFVDYEVIPMYYKKADIFVGMSRSESWGQVYVDAMACGLPVVSSTNIGSNEIVEDGRTGYLVEQENYNELAEKILFLIENPDVLRQFGQRSRQKIEREYDWESVIIPKYIEIYKSLTK